MPDLVDSVFDELAKRIKESPGWISLFLMTQSALRSTWIQSAARTLDLEIREERSTIAALIAVTFLALGDILDTAVFPREQDPAHERTVLSNAILALAAFGYLSFVVKTASQWALIGFVVIIVWVVFVLFLGKLPQLLRIDNPEETGWPMLKGGALIAAQSCARGSLHIKRGIYNVSLGLARKAGKYKPLYPLWLENEFGKLARSFVFPLVAVCMIAVALARPLEALLAAAGVPVAFCVYWRLKVWHMCGLYNKAKELVDDGDFRPNPDVMANGKRAFFWKETFAGSEP
jgi:hypothetical protein